MEKAGKGKSAVKVTLKKADINDAELIWKIQVEAFSKLYFKYQDTETNPAAESQEKTVNRINQPFTYYYLIQFNGATVGTVRVVDKKDNTFKRISPICVLEQFRNKGIAQLAIKELEKIHGDKDWELSTILEEKGNCYL